MTEGTCSRFYKSDALIDSTIMKEYLHPDVSVEWNSSKGFVQLDYDGIVDISEELGPMCDQRYGLVILYQKMI
jgi:hypothetical protein